MRIWDCFLLEGLKVLFRFSCALLSMYKNTLMEQNDTISVLNQFKLICKSTFDCDGLIKVSLLMFQLKNNNNFNSFQKKIAFEDLQPFPTRKELSVKQEQYHKSFSEKWKTIQLTQQLVRIKKKSLFLLLFD